MKVELGGHEQVEHAARRLARWQGRERLRGGVLQHRDACPHIRLKIRQAQVGARHRAGAIGVANGDHAGRCGGDGVTDEANLGIALGHENSLIE
ncbi:hypothetical protein D9M69_598750 [compost metagenome]